MKRFALLTAPFSAVLLVGFQGPCGKPPVVIASVTPAEGPDSGGTQITVHGQNFDQPFSLFIDGLGAVEPILVSPTQLVAKTPPALKQGPVDVAIVVPDPSFMTPARQSTLKGGFTYLNTPPEIESVEPAQGPTSKGIVIKVNGKHIDPTASLFIGGVPALNVWQNGPNQIVGTTPPGVAGPAEVTVKDPDGSSDTLPAGITYVSNWSETYRTLFDQRDQAYNNGNGNTAYTNEQGSLAWGESYLMHAYCVMYEATKDPWYLKKLADHADAVLEKRDDTLGVADYRGVSGAGWRNFQTGFPYGWVVHTGMITYPMARFAAIVQANSALQGIVGFDGVPLSQKAATYVQRVKESVAFHEWEWQYGPYGGEGHYRFPSIIHGGLNVPHNHQNAMGRTLVALYEATGEVFYRSRAEMLATFFQRRILSGDSVAGYVWHYWDKIGDLVFSGPADDLSHGAISVDFAVLAHQAGIVFAAYDLTGFVWTFRNRLDRGLVGSLANLVDGSGGTGTWNFQSGRWLSLGPWDWDRHIYPMVKTIYGGAFGWTYIADLSELLGIAYLARWE